VSADAQSLDPSLRAYLGSATDEGVDDAHGSADGVIYFGRQAVASAGATSYGLSAPTGMQYWIAGIEVQDSGGSTFVAPVPLVIGQAVNRSNTY
jgi:hypothetical protein